MLEAYLLLDGRIRRWRYFFYSCLLWIVLLLLTLLAVALVNNVRHPTAASVLFTVVILAFWLWAGFALVVKRLHDLNKTGWHYVWMFLLPTLLGGSFTVQWIAPFNGHWSIGYGQSFGIIPLLATLYLIFARGTDGPNDFGYPP